MKFKYARLMFNTICVLWLNMIYTKKNILYKLYIVTFIVSNFIVHIFCHTGIIDISVIEIFLPPWIWHLSRVVTAFDTKSPINQLFWFYEVARLFLLKLSWISFFIAFVCSTSTFIHKFISCCCDAKVVLFLDDESGL